VRAIIVEDEFLAAMHAEAVLEDLGVEVIGTAEDSAGAIRLAAKRPQFALIDLNLRDGFTGPAVAAQLASAGIAIVFLTANPSQLDSQDFRQAPIVEKPVDEPALAQALNAIFECRSVQN
jgi:two-component system, response regulator PdtaR